MRGAAPRFYETPLRLVETPMGSAGILQPEARQDACCRSGIISYLFYLTGNLRDAIRLLLCKTTLSFLDALLTNFDNYRAVIS